MKERLDITPTKEFLLHYYSDFYHEVATRLGHRLMYDAYNIPIKDLPIGGKENLSKIVNFLPDIASVFEKNDFYSRLNSDFNPKNIPDKTDDIFTKHLQGYLKKYDENNNPTKTLLANHAVLTLSFLSNNRRVNYDTLDFENNKYNFCEDDSVWLEKLSPEVVGKTLTELKHSTKMMLCSREGVGYPSELRAAHFFAAGYKIFQGMFPSNENISVEKDHFPKN
jgi:hypothetical protein